VPLPASMSGSKSHTRLRLSSIRLCQMPPMLVEVADLEGAAACRILAGLLALWPMVPYIRKKHAQTQALYLTESSRGENAPKELFCKRLPQKRSVMALLHPLP